MLYCALDMQKFYLRYSIILFYRESKKLKKQIILGLFSIIIILACERNTKNTFDFIENNPDSSNIELKNIGFVKQQDYLISGDSLIYLSSRVIAKGRKNTIVFVDNLNIYITDLDLNVKKIISLENEDYMFKGYIIDFEIINNKLIVIDRSNIIKVISLIENNELSEINLGIENSSSSYNENFLSIAIFNNTEILTSNTINNNQFYSNSIELGKLFTLEGKLKTTFKIKNDNADPCWKSIGDWCWVSSYKSKVYFFFTISRKAFVFDMKGKLLNVYELEVNKKYWKEPIVGETQSTIKDGATMTSVYSTYVSICWKSPQIKNNYIYSLMYSGNDIGPKIIKYNLDFEIVEEAKSNNTLPGYMNYYPLITDKRLYIFYDNIIDIYESN